MPCSRNKWSNVVGETYPCPGDNHFTILDSFANPGNRAVQGGVEDDGALKAVIGDPVLNLKPGSGEARGRD